MTGGGRTSSTENEDFLITFTEKKILRVCFSSCSPRTGIKFNESKELLF